MLHTTERRDGIDISIIFVRQDHTGLSTVDHHVDYTTDIMALVTVAGLDMVGMDSSTIQCPILCTVPGMKPGTDGGTKGMVPITDPNTVLITIPTTVPITVPTMAEGILFQTQRQWTRPQKCLCP